MEWLHGVGHSENLGIPRLESYDLVVESLGNGVPEALCLMGATKKDIENVEKERAVKSVTFILLFRILHP